MSHPSDTSRSLQLAVRELHAALDKCDLAATKRLYSIRTERELEKVKQITDHAHEQSARKFDLWGAMLNIVGRR